MVQLLVTVNLIPSILYHTLYNTGVHTLSLLYIPGRTEHHQQYSSSHMHKLILPLPQRGRLRSSVTLRCQLSRRATKTFDSLKFNRSDGPRLITSEFQVSADLLVLCLLVDPEILVGP